MRYIKARKELAERYIDCIARKKNKESVMLNEKDLMPVPGDTFDKKVGAVGGVVMTENEAINEINKNKYGNN